MAGMNHNIWNNSFYKDFKPVPKWAYELEWDISEILGVETRDFQQYLNLLSNAIVSINYGKREVSVINTFFVGLQANFPGRVQNTGELTITFNESADFKVTEILEAMFRNTAHDERFFLGRAGYRRTNVKMPGNKTNVHPLYINIFDPTSAGENWVARYEFHNLFLIAINEDNLDYSSEDELVTRTARFSYDYMIMYGHDSSLGFQKWMHDAVIAKQEADIEAAEKSREDLQKAVTAGHAFNSDVMATLRKAPTEDALTAEWDFLTKKQLEEKYTELDAMENDFKTALMKANPKLTDDAAETAARQQVESLKKELNAMNEAAKGYSQNEFRKEQDKLEQDLAEYEECIAKVDGTISGLERHAIDARQKLLNIATEAADSYANHGEANFRNMAITGLNDFEDLTSDMEKDWKKTEPYTLQDFLERKPVTYTYSDMEYMAAYGTGKTQDASLYELHQELYDKVTAHNAGVAEDTPAELEGERKGQQAAYDAALLAKTGKRDEMKATAVARVADRDRAAGEGRAAAAAGEAQALASAYAASPAGKADAEKAELSKRGLTPAEKIDNSATHAVTTESLGLPEYKTPVEIKQEQLRAENDAIIKQARQSRIREKYKPAVLKEQPQKADDFQSQDKVETESYLAQQADEWREQPKVKAALSESSLEGK